MVIHWRFHLAGTIQLGKGMCSRQVANLSWRLLILLAAAGQLVLSANVWAVNLPYDHTCPVVYDNDSHDDMYTDEYLLALASAGDITLKGMITTSGGWSEPLFPDPVFVFQWSLAGRSEIVGKALRSGFTNLPTPVAGSGVALLKPSSGVIEDTIPDDTPGARLIINEAQDVTPDHPLVVVMGGPPTTVASAYLLDNSIADKVVVAWLSGGPGENDLQNYNDLVDRWATYIVIQRLRVVLFGPVFSQSPLVPKPRLSELPDTELRPWMIDKDLPNANLPNGLDHDAPPAISLLRPDYVLAAKPKSFSVVGANGFISLQDDPGGNILIVTQADQSIGTDEWWRALKNPAAYGNNPLPPTLTAFHGSPAPIPGRIEAEEFDFGGPDVAYHDRDKKVMDQNAKRSITTFRVTDSVDFANDIGGGYSIAIAQKGEWLNYSVNVTTAGLYTLHARVSSLGVGGTFHIEFDGLDKTGPIKIPNTASLQNWQTISRIGLALEAGPHVLTIVIDANGSDGVAGDINYLDFELGSDVSSSPVPVLGTWEITTSGADAGTAFITFKDDLSLTGYGIRAGCPSVFGLSGSWQTDGASVVGILTEDSDCGTVQADLSVTVRARHSLRGTSTNGNGTDRWKGVRAAESPSLSGLWFSEVQIKGGHATTLQTYELTPQEGLPGAFDMRDENTTALLGEAIVTSANQVRAHVTVDGNQSSLTGKLNLAKRALKLKGIDRIGRKLVINASLE